MVFQCINIRQVPWEVLKTAAFGLGLGFQHLPRDLANFNAWKTMFDPYNVRPPLEKAILSIGDRPKYTASQSRKEPTYKQKRYSRRTALEPPEETATE